MFSPDTLSDDIILITGGGSGLGLAMAKTFASLGAKVAICGRTEAKLQSATEEISALGTARHYVCDVRDFEAVRAMQEAIIRDFGGLTAVVNNAAGNFLAASETLSPNAFQAVVDIVLKGSFNTTRIAGEYWIGNNQPGKVLSIVTTYTETGCAFVLPSAAAKAGVQAMMNSLAYEWAPHGIRCNSIAPGPFPTEGAWSRLMPDEDFARHMTERHPMGRVGEREELANLAAFVLSDLAPYVNGETLTIDGGERLQGAQFNAIAQHMPREQLKAIFEHMKPTKK